MNFSYTDLLELLLKLGPKLPEAWSRIQTIIVNARELYEMFAVGQQPPLAFGAPPTSFDIELEDKVMAAFNGMPQGAFGAPDFPRIREVWAFLKDHPELIKLLLSLLAL